MSSTAIKRLSKAFPPAKYYDENMARGWESKSIEAQQEDASRQEASEKPRLTREETALARELAGLRLSLSQVAEQLGRSRNAGHREVLERAKRDLEGKIASMSESGSGRQAS
jgi:hypothetical protein